MDVLTPRCPLWRQLYFQVLAAILLGILVGMLTPEVGVSLKPLGDGFIKLVKMIIAPVIFLSIVTGIARSQELRGVGHITLKALAYFAFASTAALILGLIVANVVRPGEGLNIDAATLDASKISGYVGAASHATLTDFLLGVIPSSLLGALTGADLLPVLFVLVFLGAIARRAGFSILKLVRYLRAELLLVLGTSSSESALLSLIEKMERAGCRQSVVGIVVPAGLGASTNFSLLSPRFIVIGSGGCRTLVTGLPCAAPVLPVPRASTPTSGIGKAPSPRSAAPC